MNIITSPPQPINKTLNLKTSLYLNKFKKTKFTNIKTKTNQTYISLKIKSL